MVVRGRRNGGGQLESSVLPIESLLTKLVELDLAGEIAAHQVLHFLADRWFEEVSIDPHEGVHLV